MQIRNTAVSALVAQSMLTMMLMTTGVSGFMTPVKNHHHVTMRIESASLDGDIDVETASLEKVVADNSAIASSRMEPDMAAYASGYRTAEELPCSVVEAVEGEIPDDLIGTYYKSGPAMFSAGSLLPPKTSIVQPKQPPVPDGQDPNRMVLHPFEGDGAVLGITFNGKETTARFRYVRTTAFTNERRKGLRLYTGMDTTRSSNDSAGLGNDMPLPLYRHHFQTGLNKKRKNTSNTRAVYWSKKLLTLWEGGLPYKLDALALSTEGRSQLGGVLLEESPFGAKSVYDPIKQRMIFYSNKQDSKNSELSVLEFNSKFRLVNNSKIIQSLPGFAIISDFAATQNYSIFVQPSTNINNMQFLLSKEPGKAVTVDTNAPSMMHVVQRINKGDAMRSFTIPFDGISDAELQFCNAYESEDDGTIIVDAIRSDGKNMKKQQSLKWPWAQSLQQYEATSSKKSLWRYTVNTKSGAISKTCLSDLHTSFGVINPEYSTQKHNYIYSAVGSLGSDVAPPQGIAKINVNTKEADSWFPKEHEFCGEPMFANRKKADDDDTSVEEDYGYILTVLYNGKSQKSEVLVFNAQMISSGPVARIPLGIQIPHGLHGCFTSSDEATWSEEEINRRSKLADKMESRGNMWNEVKSDFSGLGLRLDDFEEYFGDIL